MNNIEMKRGATIHAPIAQVRPMINNLHAWGQWTLWQQLDPQMTQTYTGPESGPGARTPTLVEMDIQFIKPFPEQNCSHFELVPVGEHNEHTEVT